MRSQGLKFVLMFAVTFLFCPAPVHAGGVSDFFRNLANKLEGANTAGDDECLVDNAAQQQGAQPLNSPATQAVFEQAKKDAAAQLPSVKDIPDGPFRERCFACMTMMDETSTRQLSCVCPVDNSFQRLAIPIAQCQGDEKITYCAGMLICGVCKIGNSLDDNLKNGAMTPIQENSVDDQDDVLKDLLRDLPPQ